MKEHNTYMDQATKLTELTRPQLIALATQKKVIPFRDAKLLTKESLVQKLSSSNIDLSPEVRCKTVDSLMRLTRI